MLSRRSSQGATYVQSGLDIPGRGSSSGKPIAFPRSSIPGSEGFTDVTGSRDGQYQSIHRYHIATYTSCGAANVSINVLQLVKSSTYPTSKPASNHGFFRATRSATTARKTPQRSATQRATTTHVCMYGYGRRLELVGGMSLNQRHTLRGKSDQLLLSPGPEFVFGSINSR